MKLTLKQLLLFVAGGSAGAVGTTIANSQSANAAIVKVKAGDTTWKIAQDHKTTVDQIVKDNNLKDGGNLILQGQELDVNKPGNDSKSKDTQDSSTQATNNTAYAATVNSDSQQSQSTGYQGGYQSQNNTGYTSAGSSNTSSASGYTSSVHGGEAAAKEWIAQHESGGSYTARNASSGAYGRYQLLPGYLHGDYSAANQERTADNYVKGRYGSWTAAQAFWQANGWY